ncbi:MAG: phosphogluconate dehydrogenase (NAD(+)-dependent, decarboxylating) [Lautropia sp.]
MTTTPAPQVLFVGLGKMGARMAVRLAAAGASVHGHDPAASARESAASLARERDCEARLRLHASLDDALDALAAPRVVWLMLPAGAVTTDAIERIAPRLAEGDLLVDGGNANYLESQARARALGAHGPRFADCGVSGGVWGLENGYCLMFGADAQAAALLSPIARQLAPAPDAGWLHCGPVGAGHFTKMIHNGIEYGMMQAIAEGFALLDGKREFALDLGAIGELWRHGSVVRSWLLDLTAEALRSPDALASVAPFVSDSGEGRWTVDEAVRQGTPAPVIAMALMSRFDSQGKADTGNRLLALMRQGFGGHAVRRDAG